MTRIALGEMRLGRASDEDVRAEEERQARLAALDSIAMPDLRGALPSPMGHAGEHDDAVSSARPEPVRDPEASSATAHTSAGSFADATTEPGARTGAPRARPSASELAALDEMAGRRAETTPGTPRIDPVAPSAVRPEATVRPDDSMEADDDSPDALHAMAGREPEAVVPMARDDAEPMGDQARGEMIAPSGGVEDFDGRVSRLARGGDFATSLPDGDEIELDEAEDPTPDARRAALDEMAGDKPTPTEAEPRLDDGLPSDEDIGAAHTRDDFLAPLRSLQSGLLGAIGRPRREAPHEAADLQERRDAGMLERTRAKGVQHRQETEDARAELDAQAEATQAAEAGRRADERLGMERERLDLSRESFGSIDESRDATRSRLDAAEQRRETEAGASADPSSPASVAERLAFSVARMRLRGDAARALDEALQAEGIDPSQASAAQLRRANDIIRTIGVRGTGGGGTGGGSGRAETRAAIAEQLVSRHIVSTPEEAEAVIASQGIEGAQRALQADLAPAARARVGTDAQGAEILPGVRAGLDLPAGRLRSMQDRLTTYRDGARALGEVEQLLAGRGAETVVNPALLAEIEPSLVTLRAMVAQVQGTGIINPGERPLIDATLPDASSLTGWTLGRLQSTIRGWRRRIDGATSSVLESAGVDEEGLERGVQYMHGRRSPSGPRSAPSAPRASGGLTMSDGRPAVRVRRPGQPGTILVPRAAWEASDEIDRDGAVEVP